MDIKFTYSTYDLLMLLMIRLFYLWFTYDLLILLMIYLWFTYSTYNLLLMIHLCIWAFTYPTYELLSLLTTVVCRDCFWIQFGAFYWQKHQATEHSRQGLAAYGPTAIAGWQETASSHPRRLAVSLVLDVLALSDTCKWQVPEIAVNDVLKACANLRHFLVICHVLPQPASDKMIVSNLSKISELK
jgi:hypothetical protein